MTSIPSKSIVIGIAITAAAIGLSGCTTTPEAVFANGEIITDEDFVGRTFPVYYATAEQSGAGSTSAAGIGSATIISFDQIEAAIPGEPTRIYTRVGATNEFDPGDGSSSVFLNRVGAFLLADNLDVGGTTGGVLAYMGFETPVADRPAIAFYNEDDFAVLFLAGPDFPDVDTLECFGCVDLTADFGAGTISGQLFNGTSTDPSGDFEITTNLVGGTITSDGFTGNVEALASFTPVGGVEGDVTVELSNQDVIGRFFGNGANQAAVVYEGDFAFGEGDDRVTGNYAGASDAFAD